MKRLEKRLIEEVNCKAEEFLEYFKEKMPGKEIIRLVGPNYIYFTNGSIVKVYFNYGSLASKYPEGFLFPLKYEMGLRLLRDILEDLIRIRETL